MAESIPETTITHGGQVVAVITGELLWFTSCVAVLESDHPVRRFVGMKCLVAREMQLGPDAEPYDDAIADFYVRSALLPDDEFDRLAPTRSDAALAEHFNVPLDQVAAKRYDRAYLRPPRSDAA